MVERVAHCAPFRSAESERPTPFERLAFDNSCEQLSGYESQGTRHPSTVDEAEARTTASAAHPGHERNHEHDDEQGQDHDYPFEWAEAFRIGLVALAAAAAWFQAWELFAAVNLGVLGLAQGCNGYPCPEPR
jgi:hypothetical protein